MAREIVARGLLLSLRHAPCAHICRYCLISETRKGSPLPFSRFEALVHRFLDWKIANQRDDIEIRTFVGPSFDYDIETLRGVGRIRARRGDKFQILNLGGLRIRDHDALNTWLAERQLRALSASTRPWRVVTKLTIAGMGVRGILLIRPRSCVSPVNVGWFAASVCLLREIPCRSLIDCWTFSTRFRVKCRIVT